METRSSFLRDAGLCFLPQEARSRFKPGSSYRVSRAAAVTGIWQMAVCAWLLLLRLGVFLARWAPVMHRGGEADQLVGTAVFTISFFLYPFSALLLYLCLEGFARFLTGFFLDETLPSLPVVLAWKLVERLRTKGLLAQPPPAIPDYVEVTPQGIRIASAGPKSAWNSTITIGVGGEWYQVEKCEIGAGLRPHVYLLTKVKIGRVLRAYEEYDPAAGLSTPHS